MIVVGYGDIGAACAKVGKDGFGMHVTGVKRNPNDVKEEHKAFVDEIIGNDKFQEAVPHADFIVGVLPKTNATDDFFTMETTFSKMKKSAIFMNIGRGTNVNEDDLAKALNEEIIAGAVLDVFRTEPLPEDSKLWDCPNLLITPHCADQDATHLHRAVSTFAENIELFHSGKPLKYVVDKSLGY